MYKLTKHKTQNRERILECMFRNAPVSRTVIAELTGITPATTTHTIAELIADGAVYESGQEEDDSLGQGRKRILLDICSNYRYSVGVEFNQKSFSLCITNLKGDLIYEKSTPYSPQVSAHITKVIIDSVKDVLKIYNIPESSIAGIGIAVPGHIDHKGERLISNNPIWKDLDTATIRQAFSVPVVFENNVRCMALSQYLFHPKSTPDSFAYFHVGLGMYCANMIDGKLFLGNAYVSGEIGHTIVDLNGAQCECGKQGCLQTLASEKWLLENARQLYISDPSSSLRHLAFSAEEITIHTIAAAYAIGDEAVNTIVSNALKYLGISVSNIAIFMNPEKIFLHGELFTFPDIYAELKRIISNQLSFVESSNVESVEFAPYDPIDGALGGAALAILECLLQISYE